MFLNGHVTFVEKGTMTRGIKSSILAKLTHCRILVDKPTPSYQQRPNQATGYTKSTKCLTESIKSMKHKEDKPHPRKFKKNC